MGNVLRVEGQTIESKNLDTSLDAKMDARHHSRYLPKDKALYLYYYTDIQYGYRDVTVTSWSTSPHFFRSDGQYS